MFIIIVTYIVCWSLLMLFMPSHGNILDLQDDKAVQEMETKFDQKLVEQEEECCVANLKLTAGTLLKILLRG